MMKIKEIISFLEAWAPPAYQEDYDNSGLIFGDGNWEVKGVLCALDCLESTVQEAIEKNCNLVVAHHPIVFKGIKKFGSGNYVDRTLIKAIKNDVAIYAVHTNLDNVASGVNKKISEKIGLVNTRILMPKSGHLLKLELYCPKEDSEKLRVALFENGVGNFSNYSECSFNILGEGTFKPSDKANPAIGEKGVRHVGEELKIEVVFPKYLERQVLTKMKEVHPYEEVAYQVIELKNTNDFIGSGMIGELEEEVDFHAFFDNLKKEFNIQVIKHTEITREKVKKIAVMGGSGSFGLRSAIAQGAHLYITSDFKYHEFFDADGKIVVADIGHYESEAATIELISEGLMEKFPNFVVLLSGLNTNPVRYY